MTPKEIQDIQSLIAQGNASTRIIGAPEESGYAAVCRVKIYYKKNNDMKIGSCSGVLVAKNLVLLAGHCVANCKSVVDELCKGSGTKQVFCEFITRHGTKGTIQKVKARKWYFNRKFNIQNIEKGTVNSRAKGSTLDYALLKLERDVSGIEPIPMMPFDTFVELRKAGEIRGLTAVGFGDYSKDPTKNKGMTGKKRSFTFTDFEVYPKLRALKIIPPEQTIPDLPGEVISTSHGDSGGPYFATVDGVTYLVAIISSTTFRPKTINGVKVTSFTTALSIDYPYSFFYKMFFKNVQQSIGILGYGFTMPNIPPKFFASLSSIAAPTEEDINRLLKSTRPQEEDVVTAVTGKIENVISPFYGILAIATGVLTCTIVVSKITSFK